MSKVQVDTIVDKDDISAPSLTKGAIVTGVCTATSFDGAISEWVLGANGSSDYTFTGSGLTGAENDPTLYLKRGQKYRFKNSSGGHPFRIQSTVNGSAGTAYNDGVTNNDAGDGTTLEWDVQFDTPDVLYYQCTSHGNMGGKIYIGNSGDTATITTLVATGATIGTGVTINNTGIDAGNAGIVTAGTVAAPDAMALQAGGSERVRVTSAGKVGIGSVIPGHPLDVFGNIRSHQTTPSLYLQTLATGSESAVIRFGDAASFQNGSIQYDFSGNQHLRFKMGGAGNNKERVTLEGSTGRVGVGTDSASSIVHLLDGDNPIITFGNDNYDDGVIQYNNGSFNIKTGSSTGDRLITLQTAGSERLRITSTGAISLNNGELIERCYIQSSPAWGSNGAVDLDNGVVQYNSSNYGSSPGTLAFTSSVGINTQMATGDIMSLTMITAVNNAGGYINNIQIDGIAATETWVGGAAPTGGGTSGVDTYAFNIIKTADATFLVIANQVKTS